MGIASKIKNNIAASVHWLFFLLPVSILAGLFLVAGPIPAAVVFVCGTIHFMFVILYPGSKTERKSPVLKKNDNAEIVKKNVLVIGAGPAGVAVTKELVEAGHNVTCYDASDRLGGTFANYFWPGGKLTSSPYVTAFSDYEPARTKGGEERWDHHTAEEYVQYLHDYSRHYGTIDCFNLKHKVLHVKEGEDGKTTAQVQNLTTMEITTEGPYDHVAVCSGAFHTKLTPKFKGLETFPGKLLHSRDFAASTTNMSQDEAFKECSGKSVVSIGLGESMADILGIITTKISKPTTYCACAVRKGALIIPRIHPMTKHVSDLHTTRLRHALPKSIRNMAVNLNFATFTRTKKTAIARFDLIQKLPGAGVTYVKSTKSGAFLPAIEQNKLFIKPALDRIEGNTIYYSDGSKSENVDVIIYGTGYDVPKFPFFDENSFKTSTGEKIMDPHSVPADRLFRMYNPELGNKVAYLGLGIRPLVGSIPSSAEMQARVFAMIVSEKRQLPGKSTMKKRIMEMKEFSKMESSYYIEQWFLYVNWIPFMDMLAREVGCLPKAQWLITQPGLWFKLLLSPVTTYHYRLVGYGAKPKLAKDVIYRLPGTGFRDNFFFASVHYTMSLFKWPRDSLQAVGRGVSSIFTSEKMD